MWRWTGCNPKHWLGNQEEKQISNQRGAQSSALTSSVCVSWLMAALIISWCTSPAGNSENNQSLEPKNRNQFIKGGDSSSLTSCSHFLITPIFSSLTNSHVWIITGENVPVSVITCSSCIRCELHRKHRSWSCSPSPQLSQQGLEFTSRVPTRLVKLQESWWFWFKTNKQSFLLQNRDCGSKLIQEQSKNTVTKIHTHSASGFTYLFNMFLNRVCPWAGLRHMNRTYRNNRSEDSGFNLDSRSSCVNHVEVWTTSSWVW